jgi:hypothetical protein
MCDYYLRGRCFHPKRTKKGMVAAKCQVHSCNDCTHKQWQDKQIEEDHSFYQDLIDNISKEIKVPSLQARPQPE